MRYIKFTEDLTSNQNQKIKKEKHLKYQKDIFENKLTFYIFYI